MNQFHLTDLPFDKRKFSNKLPVLKCRNQTKTLFTSSGYSCIICTIDNQQLNADAGIELLHKNEEKPIERKHTPQSTDKMRKTVKVSLEISAVVITNK